MALNREMLARGGDEDEDEGNIGNEVVALSFWLLVSIVWCVCACVAPHSISSQNSNVATRSTHSFVTDVIMNVIHMQAMELDEMCRAEKWKNEMTNGEQPEHIFIFNN